MVNPVSVNLVGVLAAAIATLAIGMAWYSPMLFGRRWMAYMGWKEKDMEQKKKEPGKMLTSMAGGFLTSVVTAFMLAQVLAFTGAAGVVGAMQAAFWMWLGFVATVMAGMVLWEGKPVGLYLLNGGYHLASFLAMAAILASM